MVVVQYNFSYLIDKIEKADFESSPFRHVYIENFFSSEHFNEIIQSNEIKSPSAKSDSELIDGLYGAGFKIINFPGCVTDRKKYISWHEGGKNPAGHTACEGFGMAFRLFEFSSPVLKAINEFIVGAEFNSVIAQKFGINISECTVDGGIQKYLDGYEISPHPDIRKKAATFMVNINPDLASEEMNHHTHYMSFIESREYVKKFWEGNPIIDRAWIPWGWAVSEKQQNKNNSIVLFSPSDDTLHAVKADYDHLKTQRTQLYGNLWYEKTEVVRKIEWEGLDLIGSASDRGSRVPAASRLITEKLTRAVKKTSAVLFNRDNIGKRGF